jgi:Mg2+ and Co2+ transporter CorA
MRFNVSVSIEEEGLAGFICDLLTRCSVTDTDQIEYLVRGKDYEAVLEAIEEHRKKLFSLDTTLEDVSQVVRGYLELKNPPSLPVEITGTEEEEQE